MTCFYNLLKGFQCVTFSSSRPSNQTKTTGLSRTRIENDRTHLSTKPSHSESKPPGPRTLGNFAYRSQSTWNESKVNSTPPNLNGTKEKYNNQKEGKIYLEVRSVPKTVSYPHPPWVLLTDHRGRFKKDGDSTPGKGQSLSWWDISTTLQRVKSTDVKVSLCTEGSRPYTVYVGT